jgi:hypothetical protein
METKLFCKPTNRQIILHEFINPHKIKVKFKAKLLFFCALLSIAASMIFITSIPSVAVTGSSMSFVIELKTPSKS